MKSLGRGLRRGPFDQQPGVLMALAGAVVSIDEDFGIDEPPHDANFAQPLRLPRPAFPRRFT